MLGPDARKLRRQTGYTIAAWAELLGIQAGTVRNIETGNTPKTAPGKALEKLWILTAEKYKKENILP